MYKARRVNQKQDIVEIPVLTDQGLTTQRYIPPQGYAVVDDDDRIVHRQDGEWIDWAIYPAKSYTTAAIRMLEAGTDIFPNVWQHRSVQNG